MATVNIETTVNVDKSSLLWERKDNIESQFNVLLSREELMQEDKTLPTEIPTIQWIKLTGTKNDCQNAMEYIRALCNPRVWTEFLYDPEQCSAVEDLRLGEVEKQTRAALITLSDSPGYIFIQGDELSIALAESLLFERFIEYSGDKGCQKSNSDSCILLDSVLERTLAVEDIEVSNDGNVSMYPDEIKRALLLTVSEEKRNDQAAQNDRDRSISDRRSESSRSEPDRRFEAVSRSKSDDDDVAVVDQCSDNKVVFFRTLSKYEKSESPGVRVGSPESIASDYEVVDLDTDESSDDIICLRSEYEDDDAMVFDTTPTGKQPERFGNATSSTPETGSSQSSNAVSKKKKNKKKKKNAGEIVSSVTRKADVLESSPMPAKYCKNVPLPGAESSAASSRNNSSGSAMGGRPEMGQQAQSYKDMQRKLSRSDYSERWFLQPNSSLRPEPLKVVGPNVPARGQDRFGQQQNFMNSAGMSRISALPSSQERRQVVFGGGPKLRYIVIDGSNIAMHHSNGKFFSCRGLRIVVDYFIRRGHSKITAIVPQWRRQQALTSQYPIKDQQVLEELSNDGYVAFSPSRRIKNRNIVPYDDRFILELASQTNGVVISNDNYRDLYDEKREFREIIEERLLPYTLVGDIFILPEDPLGRGGPTLDQFLYMPSAVSSTDTPAARQFFGDRQSANDYPGFSASAQPGFSGWMRLPPTTAAATSTEPTTRSTLGAGGHRQSSFPSMNRSHQTDSFGSTNSSPTRVRPRDLGPACVPPPRSSLGSDVQSLRSDRRTTELRSKLRDVFPDNIEQIDCVLRDHPLDDNLDKLSSLLLGMLEDS